MFGPGVVCATELRTRAERKCGQMLRDAAASEDRASAEKGIPTKASSTPTFSQIGVTRDQSSKWQQTAAPSGPSCGRAQRLGVSVRKFKRNPDGSMDLYVPIRQAPTRW